MYLYGASGHAKVILDIINTSTEYVVKGIYDDDPEKKNLEGIPVLNTIDGIKPQGEFIISIGNNAIRKKIAETINASFVTGIHQSAIVSKINVLIGKGTVVMPLAVINPATSIGKHCIINTASVVEHDCTIEDYVHISPNAALAGNVSVGEGTQIGIGANVIPGVSIGEWCVIGAGSTVIKDVPDYSVVVGSPAKFIRKNT